jgi:aryl-alcohol dehydrogenase-like predicted oxidoreductase
MSISGFATPEGTLQYRDKMATRCAESHFREVDNLWWSSIGLGTYLGHPDKATDRLVAEATIRSVEGGINVIDTAINYRRQHAEQSVGVALKTLIESGKYQREEIVICTKGGFLPHPGRGKWFKEKYVDDSSNTIGMGDLSADCHCMHPEYLADQLEQSRKNLGLETIDLYYIHNPETQLSAVDNETYYGQLSTAFEMLEGAVADGKIRYYGMATWNTFRLPETSDKQTSLKRAKELAKIAAGDGPDHLRFIQLPFNLSMPEAFNAETQYTLGEMLPAIPAARKLDIYPIISGSIAQGNINALPQSWNDQIGEGYTSDKQRALQITRSAPGIASALIGMKQPEHVSENLALGALPPLDATLFENFLSKIKKG